MGIINRFLLFGMCVGSFLSCQREQIIYVDSDARDNVSAKGTLEAPFQTVSRALNVVKELRSKGKMKPCKIVLRGGTYHFKQGILLDQHFSDLTLAAYSGEEVIFSGGCTIPINLMEPTQLNTGQWLQHVDLKKAGIYDYGKIKNTGFARPYQPSWGELFVNDKPMRLSRWPNEGMIRMGKILDQGSVPRDNDFSNRGAIMAYDSLRISTWQETKDMWIGGYFKYGYADDQLRIESLNKTKRTITTDGATLYGFYSGFAWNKWHAFNILEETDQPGEYFLDRMSGLLYFLSPDAEVSSLTLTLLEEPFFDIRDVENVRMEHIIFEYSRAALLSLCDTRNVVIDNCTFRNSGDIGITVGMGVEPFTDYRHDGDGKPTYGTVGSLQQHLYANQTFYRRGGFENKIEGCSFYNLGAGGISLGGGDRMTLKPGNNVVRNCLFHDNNRIARSYRPAVHVTGVGNRIEQCEIYNTPSMAILLNGNDHLIENNYIHHVCLEVEDQGAFYYGRNPSECGTVLRNNLFAHIPDIYNTCAVYHDDGAGGLTVEDNIFYRAGRYAVLMGGGSDNIYARNLFINGKMGIHVDQRLQNWAKSLIAPEGIFEQRLAEVNYHTAPYSTAYPYLADYLPNDSLPKRNVMTDNHFIGINQITDNSQLLQWSGEILEKDTLIIDNFCKDAFLEKLQQLGYRKEKPELTIGRLN